MWDNQKNVEQYFTCITDLINKMKGYGKEISDNKVVEKI